jgi:hypothetical protein
MCYGNPAQLLEAALEAFPQHSERFEADFEHWSAYSGACIDNTRCADWARWAFWSAGDYNGSDHETV